jgi:hypothetical protein
MKLQNAQVAALRTYAAGAFSLLKCSDFRTGRYLFVAGPNFPIRYDLPFRCARQREGQSYL